MAQDNRLIPVSGIERGLDRPLGDLAQSKPYGVSPTDPTSIRDYFHVVMKRKWLILSLVVVITSLVTVQEYRLPNSYQGAATIKIEQRPKNVLQMEKTVINSGTDPNYWNTQLRLLQSPSLARQVVLTLDLQHNPSFFGAPGQDGLFASLRRAFSRENVSAAPASSGEMNIIGENELKDQPLTPQQLAALEPYEDTIIGSELVEAIGGTNLVTIKYTHTDPDLARKIADTLAEVFVNNNLERATLGTTKAEDLLEKEVARYQTTLKREQEERLNYARANSLPLTSETNVEVPKLMALSSKVLEAQNKRKNLQAAYEAAQSASDPYTIPEVLAANRIEKLRDQINGLRQKREALLTKYTERWPAVQEIDNQLKPIEAELQRAPAEVIAAMKSRYEAALSEERMLTASYNQQKGTTTEQTRHQIEMTAMGQQIESDKQYLNTLLQRERDLNTGARDKPNEVSIETASRLPRVPIGPNRFRSIMIAFLISLVGGIGVAFLLDFLDDTVKTIDDIDRHIHLPALALIPAGRERLVGKERLRLRGLNPISAPSDSTALAMIDDVRSPIAESYRHLRTSLLLSSAGQPPKTILVTSSQPSEGKTTTAINTAFMLAQTGAQVLIIDCDLRRPKLHSHFGLANVEGLTNCLSGDLRDVDALIKTYDKQPNLKVLTSGPIPPNPAELLGSSEMRSLLASLSAKFAHIIVDSPPAISFTDASILSTFVDGVILVVHSGRSSRAVVRRAKQQLQDIGAHIFGVVLNNVKLETKDYYYAGYYSSRYYTDPGDDEGAEVTPDNGARAPGAS